MRVTIDLDDDIHATVKKLARQQGATMGRFLSDLLRPSLTAKPPIKIRNGFWLLEPRPGAPRADMELVNRLRDEE